MLKMVVSRCLLVTVAILIHATGLAEPGFFKISSPKIPETVQLSGASVFRIVLFFQEPYGRVKKQDYIEYKSWVRKTYCGFKQDFLISRINDCQRSKAPYCELSFAGNGSAFVVQNSSILWSIRHNFQTLITAFNRAHPDFVTLTPKQRHNAQKRMPLNIMLINQDEEVVFDSRDESDHAFFEFLGTPEVIESFDDSTALALADVVKIQLNHTISDTALTFEDRVPKVGEPVFSLGYPDATEDRTPCFGARDSDGISLQVGIGEVIPFPENYKGLLWANLGFSQETIQDYGKKRLFFCCDGTYGMSGGPILNAKGRVVSIVSRHWWPNQCLSSKKHPVGGHGPTMPWVFELIDAVEEFEDETP